MGESHLRKGRWTFRRRTPFIPVRHKVLGVTDGSFEINGVPPDVGHDRLDVEEVSGREGGDRRRE